VVFRLRLAEYGRENSVVAVDRRTVDRTNVHRLWHAVLVCCALIVVMACLLKPFLLLAIGLFLLLFVCGRLIYPGRGHYIPNLYARDIRIYDPPYRAFIGRTLSELRHCKVRGHPLLREAAYLGNPNTENPDELLLDLGVWIGWSTRLIADACGRKVYGFDTFSGLVEDWQLEDQIVKRGSFSLSQPFARRFIRYTGVSLENGVPAALGRNVHFVRGSTYDTLAPFLADRPATPIKLFHMDLDTYESCIHALEACKDRFVPGSILVFDEFLVTNGEMRAFYEFQKRYELEWRYRAWGLEVMEMNVEMIKSRWTRVFYYVISIPLYWLLGDGNYAWACFRRRFWRFWLGAPLGDIRFLLSVAGSRKAVSLEITGLGKLERPTNVALPTG
jgi:hypothetical protein